ncbi:MAG: TetR family transcriptional regulator [Ilumatobacteraceae bacterium]|nr:TetR family transcriptional regulator [Ilumatobacteraceae bacterium]
MTSTAARTGRPPRIDRAAIARAVIELGFDRVTMKSTAAHMGMSVPGLYHYVKGRDELLRLAAEYSLASVAIPQFTGQDWQTWLREWARYTRTTMSAHPEVLEQFLTGGIDSTRHVEVVEHILAVLVDHGFAPVDAQHAWLMVSAIALGTAAMDIGEATARVDGRPWIARVHGELARHRSDELPVTRALVAQGFAPEPDRDFERSLDVAIAGIGALRNEPKRTTRRSKAAPESAPRMTRTPTSTSTDKDPD